MNILDFWPDDPKFYNTRETWDYLYELRNKTFHGFAAIEARNGLLIPGTYVHTSQGQEMLRILFFRTLEESAESVMAVDEFHKREEAIDAMNYLMAVMLMDPHSFPVEARVEPFTSAVEDLDRNNDWGQPLTTEKLGLMTFWIGGELCDTFRHRAWMNHAQDIYFAGFKTTADVIRRVAATLIGALPDFDTFVRFYLAKDGVLQFRLKSNY